MSCRTHTHKYVRRTYVEPNELYDLVADPGETRNLSGLSEYAEIEREMETRMLDFLMRTTDVLPHESDSRHV